MRVVTINRMAHRATPYPYLVPTRTGPQSLLVLVFFSCAEVFSHFWPGMGQVWSVLSSVVNSHTVPWKIANHFAQQTTCILTGRAWLGHFSVPCLGPYSIWCDLQFGWWWHASWKHMEI